MSIPTNQLVFAGTWSVSGIYPQFQYVLSPIDGNCYVNVAILTSVGGPDPSVQPSTTWVLLDPFAGAGIQSLNGLTDTAMNIVSSDASVGINPVAPDKVDLSVAGGFAPAYGSFSSTQTQTINPLFPTIAPLPLIYDTKDCTSIGLNALIPTAFIQVDYKGVYKILSSVQCNRTIGGNSEMDMYLVVNGNAVPNTASKLLINANEESVMTIEWFVDLNANDTLNIELYSNNAGNEALAVLPNPPVPAIPSVITTILRIA